MLPPKSPPGSSRAAIDTDVETLLDEVDAALHLTHARQPGQYQPPVDILESDAAVDVVMDLSGVAPEAVRVFLRSSVLLIVGHKAPPANPHDHTFHLVEREFGRFARAVTLNGAFDVDAIEGLLRQGELTIHIPKRIERRGEGRRISIRTSPSEPPPA